MNNEGSKVVIHVIQKRGHLNSIPGPDTGSRHGEHERDDHSDQREDRHGDQAAPAPEALIELKGLGHLERSAFCPVNCSHLCTMTSQ